MKLHEEFKEYESLWEDSRNPYIKTFGRKTYDLTNKDELKAWIETNAEFQMKRHPNRYAKDPTEEPMRGDGEEKALDLKITIVDNLFDRLSKEGVDQALLDSVHEEVMNSLHASVDRFHVMLKAEERRFISAALDAGIKAFEAEMAKNLDYYGIERIRPEVKEKVKQELVDKIYNNLNGNNTDKGKYYIPSKYTGVTY